MMDDHSLIISDGHMEHPGFIAMKPQGMEEVILGNNHVGQFIFHDNVGNEMIVEQNIEVGGDDDPHGEIILVPNNMIKQEDIIEGGEIVVGSAVGDEVIIGNPVGTQIDSERFVIGSAIEMGSDQVDDATFDEAKLVIDTALHLTLEESPTIAYDCGECGALLRSRASLKKHIKSQHTKQKSKSKDKKSKNKDISNSSNKLYNCPSCSYSTQRRDKLDKHIQKHVLVDGFHPCGKRRHKPQDPPQRHRHNAEEYKCLHCPYSCTVYKAFKKHQKLHMSANKDFSLKVSCKICGKDRPTEADLRKHMNKHRSEKNFVCDICGFASIQLKKIIQHRRMHTGEKPHLCPHCPYRSARRDNLRSHVRRMHKKENMYIDTFNPDEEIPD